MPPPLDPQILQILQELRDAATNMAAASTSESHDKYSGFGRMAVSQIPGYQAFQSTLQRTIDPTAGSQTIAQQNLAIAQELRRAVNALGSSGGLDAQAYRTNLRFQGGDFSNFISIPGLSLQDSMAFERTSQRYSGGALNVYQSQAMAGATAQSAAALGIQNQQMNSLMSMMGNAGVVGGYYEKSIGTNVGGFQFDQKEFALTMAQALERGKLWDRLDDVMRTMAGLTQQAMSRGGAADPVGNMGIMANLNRMTQGDRRLQEMTPNIMAMVDQGLQGAANNPLVMAGFLDANPINNQNTFLQRRLQLRKELESGNIGKKLDIVGETFTTIGGDLMNFTKMDDISLLSDKDIQSMEMLEKQFGFGSASNTQAALLLAQKTKLTGGANDASAQAARQRLSELNKNADFTNLTEQSNQISAARVAVAGTAEQTAQTIRSISTDFGKNDQVARAVQAHLPSGKTIDTASANELSDAFNKAMLDVEKNDPGHKRTGIDSDLTALAESSERLVKKQEEATHAQETLALNLNKALETVPNISLNVMKLGESLGKAIDFINEKILGNPPATVSPPGGTGGGPTTTGPGSSAPGPAPAPRTPGQQQGRDVAGMVVAAAGYGASLVSENLGTFALSYAALKYGKPVLRAAASPRQTVRNVRQLYATARQINTPVGPAPITPHLPSSSRPPVGDPARAAYLQQVRNARAARAAHRTATTNYENKAKQIAEAEEAIKRLPFGTRKKRLLIGAGLAAATALMYFGKSASAAPIPEGSDIGPDDGEYFSPGGPVAIDPSERGGFLENQPLIAPPVTAGARVALPVTAGGRVAPPRTAPSRGAPAQPLTDDIEDTLGDIADTAGTALDVTELAYGSRNAVSTYRALRAALAAKQAKNAATVAQVANAANTVRVGAEAATVAKIGLKGAASTAFGGAFLANDIYNTVADEPLFDQERPSALRWAFGTVGAVTAGVLATPETFGIATVPAAIAGYGAGTALYDAGNALINKVPGWWEKGKEWVSEKLSSDKPGSLENIDTIASAAMMIEQAAVETMVVDNLVINGTQTLNAQGPNLLPQSRATAHNTNQLVTLTYGAVSEGSAGSSAYTPSDGPIYYPSGAAQAGTVALPTVSLTNAALTGTSNRRVGSTVSNILIDPKTGRPVNAIITSDMYDQRVSGSNRYLHAAYDLAVNGDTSGYGMVSLTDATIAAAGQNKELGNFVTMKIGGEGANAFYVTYDHLQDPTGFKVGESVKRGQIVGKVGHTGTGGGADSHAHISGRLGGTPSNSAAEGVVGGQVVDPIAALAEFLETSGSIALPDQSQGTASGEFAKRMVAATQAARAALLTAGGSTVAASSSTVAPPSVGNFSPTVASTAAANKVELTINIKPDEKGFIRALAEASQTNNVRAEITDGRIKFTIDTTTSGAR